MQLRRRGSRFLAMLVLAWSSIAAASETQPGETTGDGRTPPRLSYTEGRVSYWRPGAQDWVGAPLNVPLAAGDELYTGPDGTLEIQVGPRAWVRAWAATALGIVEHEPDYLQLKLTGGHAALDVRALEPGHTLELSTPNAAFTIERPGYYRVSVTAERTSFIARRGGSAVATPQSGQAIAVGSPQELIVEGTTAPAVTLAAAAGLDTWDRWNYARTEALFTSVSARHVSSGVYGAADLDQHGTWQVVETYGNVWVPRDVPGGWAPYTTGSWIRDPYYGWTWVDTAPWGWAPYHYGRWVNVRGLWAWAPGPVVARPVYAPALVAFFSGPGVAVSLGPPAIGWCALGWGEPIVPWWGRPGFVGVPSWRGWGGPRVVNNVVVHNTTVVNVKQITVYSNARVKDAVIAVPQDHFGGQRVADHRLRPGDMRHIEPALPAIPATPASLVPAVKGPAAITPSRDIVGRPVVSKRFAPGPVGRALPPTGQPGRADAGSAAGKQAAPQLEPVPPGPRPSARHTEPLHPAARGPRQPDPEPAVRERGPSTVPPATVPRPAGPIMTEPRAGGEPVPGAVPARPRPAKPDIPSATDRVRREPPALRPAITEPAPAPPGRPTSPATLIPSGGQIQPRNPAGPNPQAAPVMARPDQRTPAYRPAQAPSAIAPLPPAPRMSPVPEPRISQRAPPQVRAPEPRVPPRTPAQASTAQPKQQGQGHRAGQAEASEQRATEGSPRGAR